MKLMLVAFVVTASLIALAILAWAAPEVTIAQRMLLGSIPLAVSGIITWMAWKDT